MGHLGNPVAVTPNLDRLVETDAVSSHRGLPEHRLFAQPL